MPIEIKVPPLSESITEATLLAWHKKEGDRVKEGENLIDLETDKIVLELPAPRDGVLTRILKADGATVAAGEVIARLDADNQAEASPSPAPGIEPPVSPSARKLAAEHAIDSRAIPGSHRGGRATKDDVQALLDQAAVKTAAPEAPPLSVAASATDGRPAQRVPMTRLRARVAERLVEAQRTAAILTTFNEVNMQPVIELRQRYKDKFDQEFGIKLGFMSLFVKAASTALKKFPVVNASVEGGDIVYHGYFDIGIAVGTERGLVVPVLRNADQLSFADIERGIADFARKAKDGKLSIAELSGGTFTITNGGIFGSLLSTPIINPPQSAILGMHAIKERPIAENGQVVIRPMMYLALSYDHRLVDGRDAVQFLVAIKDELEDPARLLLEI
ncbi:MAG: 2-oxoglutarate dehydrogenase complex dihydrolipoyllysine-residue succinyltransferase [Burkholderiales bacterium]